MLGIIGAMRQEVVAIEGALLDGKIQHRLGCELYVGQLAGTDVIVVQSGTVR